MTRKIHVVCPQCQTVNRANEARLKDGPTCGKCSCPLFQGVPIPVGPRELEKNVTRTELPIVVDFWAPWCGPCRMMARVFEEVARRLEPRVRFLKVDTDRYPELASRYAIRGVPTLVLFLQGKEVGRQTGMMDATELIAWIRQGVDKASPSA